MSDVVYFIIYEKIINYAIINIDTLVETTKKSTHSIQQHEKHI